MGLTEEAVPAYNAARPVDPVERPSAEESEPARQTADAFNPVGRSWRPGPASQQGRWGYILAWALGVPIPILIIIYLLRG